MMPPAGRWKRPGRERRRPARPGAGLQQAVAATITVEHVEGEWYAVAYLDTYENRCVIIPFRALLRKGQLVITDVVLP